MPVLSRLRLGSIGVAAARFDPLDLELVGPDLRLRHTLLALGNGGGKSSLIGLVLVLLNPKVGTVLGRTSRGDRKLETDYVRRGETGIVLAEWLPDHPGPGAPRRHVTFLAMQRGERDGAAEKGFVGATLPMDVDPVEAFELSQLVPLAERPADSKAHAVDALLRRARELQREQPTWEVVAVPGFEPGRWLEHLRTIGLDPGLATLLARMNLEEGDLAKALTFSSADEFVAQAARLLAPPDEVQQDLQRGIQAWASEHRDQADKRVARDELTRVRPRWAALVERADAHRVARERLKEEAFDVLALLDGVERAQPDVRARVDTAEQGLRDAEAERTAATDTLACLDGEAAAIEDALARVRLEQATADVAAATTAATRADRDERLARALLPALRLADADARTAALQAQRAVRSTEAAPLARRRDALALGLANHSRDESSRARLERDEAQAAREQATTEARAARAALSAHERREAGLVAEHTDLARRLALARKAVERLVREGALVEGEALGRAVGRAAAAAREAEELVATTRDAHRAAEQDRARAEAEAKSHARHLQQLGRQRQTLDRALETAAEACRSLSARIVVAAVPELAGPDLPADGARALDVLRAAHRDVIVSHATSAARVAALDATCESLRARDVLPAPTDVRAVCDQASVTPALEFLRATHGDAAGDVLRSVPGLAHGAVASSKAALDRARERLEQLELSVDAPVPVYLAADLTPEALARASKSAVAPRAVVGLAPHASADARGALLERRTSERDHVRRLVSEQAERATTLGELVHATTEVLGRHGQDAQDALREELAASDAELRATAEAQAQAQVAATEAAKVVEQRAADAASCANAARTAADVAQKLQVLVESHGDTLDRARARLAELVALTTAVADAIAAARRACEEATDRAERARDRVDAAERARSAADERTRRFVERVEDPTTAPAAIDDLVRNEAELDALHRELVAGQAALELALLDLRTQSERLRKDLREAAGDDETIRTARGAITPGLTEATVLDRARHAAEAARAAVAATATATARRTTADAHATRARRSLGALAGAAAAAARAWLEGPQLEAPQEPSRANRVEASKESAAGDARSAAPGGVFSRTTEPAALSALNDSVPARRDEVSARVARAVAGAVEAARARDAAIALARTWSGIVEQATEAWDAVRSGAPDLEPAIRAVVREGRNSLVVLDPAGQALKLGQAAGNHRRAVVARKTALERAQEAWLGAARTAIVEAERSSSEVVRRFATIRLASRPLSPSALRVAGEGGADAAVAPTLNADGDADAERVRAVAERSELDLEQLDREVEDLDAQLADVARTRATLAQQLGEQVQRLGNRVRELQRDSVLPEGLGAWSGQEFLRVELLVLSEPAELHARLEAHLVAWADRDAVPTTRDLLPDALAGSLSSPPSVLLPKADRFDRPPRRRPISQLAKDSGGEALTAAFILFCVLARVVSGGARRERRVTLALIDNPLGTANRFDFVDAQCAVAAAFGVQYIAATGITDPAAIERFERLITLTNPGQDRVAVQRQEDRGLGQPIESVLWGRDAVLTPIGGVPRRWGGPSA